MRPDESVVFVAQLMRDEHVGCVVVVDRDRRPLGIVTDRDLAVRILAEEVGPRLAIEHAMSRDLRTIEQHRQMDDAFSAMRDAGVRRLPIVDGERRLVGLVSLDDLTVLLASEMRFSSDTIAANRGP